MPSASDLSLPVFPVVIVTGLVKQFGRFAALRGVSAEFAPRRLYAILGDNGAGKTTLLRALAGLTPPTRGSISLLGTTDLRSVCGQLGYMAHPSLLYDEMSGMENLRYFTGLYGLQDDNVCRNAMQMVGLDPELSRRIGQYSQGMRQRLSLARAMLHNPELILLGTGTRQLFPDPHTTAGIFARGVGLEIMDTRAACRTFNVLVSEYRRVVAALFVI